MHALSHRIAYDLLCQPLDVHLHTQHHLRNKWRKIILLSALHIYAIYNNNLETMGMENNVCGAEAAADIQIRDYVMIQNSKIKQKLHCAIDSDFGSMIFQSNVLSTTYASGMWHRSSTLLLRLSIKTKRSDTLLFCFLIEQTITLFVCIELILHFTQHHCSHLQHHCCCWLPICAQPNSTQSQFVSCHFFRQNI